MLLKNGSNGPEVAKMQALLGVGADGSFGPGTETAVKAWQQANGLTPDGIVGDATWAKMFGAALVAAPSATPIPPSSFKLENLAGHVPAAVIA